MYTDCRRSCTTTMADYTAEGSTPTARKAATMPLVMAAATEPAGGDGASSPLCGVTTRYAVPREVAGADCMLRLRSPVSGEALEGRVEEL